MPPAWWAVLVMPDADVPEASLAEVNFPAKAFYLLSAVGICASSSEARRQIKGGAARLEGEKITDPNQEFASAAELEGKVLQLGKKTFRRLVALVDAFDVDPQNIERGCP